MNCEDVLELLGETAGLGRKLTHHQFPMIKRSVMSAFSPLVLISAATTKSTRSRDRLHA